MNSTPSTPELVPVNRTALLQLLEAVRPTVPTPRSMRVTKDLQMALGPLPCVEMLRADIAAYDAANSNTTGTTP